MAVVAAAALIYVLGILVPAAEGEAAEPIAAPVTLYWVLLVIGVVGAVIGYVLGQRSPTGGAES